MSVRVDRTQRSGFSIIIYIYAVALTNIARCGVTPDKCLVAQVAQVALFRKDKTPEENVVPRDPSKARVWFDRAAAVADTRQYDYAIELYIDGLRHDPGNQAMHENLREVALKRKIGGGKPAGLAERFKSAGNNPIDKFLHTEKIWTKNPLNLALILQAMKLAIAADKAAPNESLAEVAYWIGTIILENSQTTKRPDKAAYLELREMFGELQAYDKAVLACRMAMQLDPTDTDLQNELKDLEAENTLQQGRYSDTDGTFRDSVREMAKQHELAQEDTITKTESMIEQIIQRRRSEYEQDPNDLNRLQKLTDALLQKDCVANEDEASQLIQKAYNETGQYRYKVQIGDIRIKQMTREYREAKAVLNKDPNDSEARTRLEATYRDKMKFELAEYTERVKNYPTELGLKFQLGVRLFAFKKYDEAIGAFQQAKSDPKHRAASYDYLGRCYLARNWFDEAVDTFRQGIEIHPIADDRLGKELRYQLMAALANAGEKNKSIDQAREAQKIASQLLQTDINYRDIRDRIDTLRTLVDRLHEKS